MSVFAISPQCSEIKLVYLFVASGQHTYESVKRFLTAESGKFNLNGNSADACTGYILGSAHAIAESVSRAILIHSRAFQSLAVE